MEGNQSKERQRVRQAPSFSHTRYRLFLESEETTRIVETIEKTASKQARKTVPRLTKSRDVDAASQLSGRNEATAP